jgi:hypothetical protein
MFRFERGVTGRPPITMHELKLYEYSCFKLGELTKLIVLHRCSLSEHAQLQVFVLILLHV